MITSISSKEICNNKTNNKLFWHLSSFPHNCLQKSQYLSISYILFFVSIPLTKRHFSEIYLKHFKSYTPRIVSNTKVYTPIDLGSRGM